MARSKKIKSRILGPILISTLVLTTAFFVIMRKLNTNQINTEAKTYLDVFTKVLDFHKDEHIALIENEIISSLNNDLLIDPWLKRDKDKLYKNSQNLLRSLQIIDNTAKITFVDTNGLVYLDINSESSENQKYTHSSFLQAKKYKIISTGLEYNQNEGIISSVTIPWHYKQKVIGYITATENIQHQILTLEDLFQSKILILVKKDYINAVKGNKIYQPNNSKNDNINNYQAIYNAEFLNSNSYKIGENFLVKDAFDIEYDNETLTIVPQNLINAQSYILGKMYIVLKLDWHKQELSEDMFSIFKIGILIGAFLIFFFYFVVNRIERDLDNLENKANEEAHLREIQYTDHIQKLRNEEAKLKISEKKFRSVFEQSRDAILWANSKTDLITACNSAAEILLEKNRYEIIGTERKSLFPPDKADKYLNEISRKVKLLGYIDEEVEIITKTGKVKHVLISGGPIETDGQIILQGIFHDITERKSFEKQILESKARLKQVINSTKSIVWEIDSKFNYTYLSPALTEILGFTEEELLGKSIFKYFVSEEEIRNSKREIGKSILATQKFHNIETQHFTKNGEIVWFLTSGVSAFDETTKGYKIRGVAIDITERKLAEEILKNAKEKAEQADKLKTTFLTQMSHEIRTPVNSIVSLTGLIKQEYFEKADEEMAICFDLIKKNSSRLIRTTDELINLSEIQAGTFELHNNNIDIKGILEEVIKNYSELASEKNIIITLENQTTNTMIFSDSYSISQIFEQLIDNSIQYSEKGEITIFLQKDENKNLIVSIKDEGIGISEEYLPKIFDPFTQEETGFTRKFEGNGIGLTIVKEFCKLNNAKIEVESKKGEGTTFKVFFNNKSLIS